MPLRYSFTGGPTLNVFIWQALYLVRGCFLAEFLSQSHVRHREVYRQINVNFSVPHVSVPFFLPSSVSD